MEQRVMGPINWEAYLVEAESSGATVHIPVDGIFTTFRVPIDEAGLRPHLERLRTHAVKMGLKVDYPLESLMAWVIQKWQEPRVVRICLADGLAISTRDVPQDTDRPLKIKSMRYEKPMPTLKHGDLQAGFAIRDQVREEDFDDAVWINNQGHVTEATTANVWGIAEGGLWTPSPEQDGCLEGITRAKILAIAKSVGVDVHCRSISVAQLLEMDGVFLSNAVIGVQPVVSVDGVMYPWSEIARSLYERVREKLG